MAQQEHQAIKLVIEQLFSALQQGDSAKARSCFIPETRLQTALESLKTGKTKLKTEPLDSFFVQVNEIRVKKLNIEERILTYDIQVDYPMAAVWANYEFYIDGKYSHKGVDAFQLFKTEQGWKIIQLCDTRKK